MLYVAVLQGESPETARPVPASTDRAVVEAVLRAFEVLLAVPPPAQREQGRRPLQFLGDAGEGHRGPTDAPP